MIFKRNPKKLSGGLERPRDLIVLRRRLRIAGWVVVSDDNRTGVRQDRGFEYLSWADDGAREVADARHVNADQIVLRGEHHYY